jgi:transcriptional regulator with XRE-family HTH domain
MTEQELRGILSRNIRRHRRSRNLSQADLAERLDISVNFLCNIENGNRWVSPKTLVKFGSALNIEPYELLKPENAMPPDTPLILNKCLDEAVVAVTQALNQVRGYYVLQAGTLPED